jgi:hypothetical protein
MACNNFLKLKHNISIPHWKKGLIETTMQSIKERTESIDDYFSCTKANCKQKHIKQWIKVFAYYHNNNIRA